MTAAGQPLLYTTNVGLPLANVAHESFSLLTKYQLTDVWELGGQAVYRLQDLRRHLAGREPGHVAAELLAFRCLRGSQDRQELDREAVRQQHLQQALLRCACTRAPRRSFWTRRAAARPCHCGEVLNRCHADLRSRCPEQGRCGGFPPHHGRLRLGGRPLDRRRAIGAGKAATNNCRRTARSRANSATASFRRWPPIRGSSRPPCRCRFSAAVQSLPPRTGIISASMSITRCAAII